nr:uncharacterized protein LOC109184577 [Ipomoea batatas]
MELSWKSLLFWVMQLMIWLSLALACADVYPLPKVSKTLLSTANGASINFHFTSLSSPLAVERRVLETFGGGQTSVQAKAKLNQIVNCITQNNKDFHDNSILQIKNKVDQKSKGSEKDNETFAYKRKR